MKILKKIETQSLMHYMRLASIKIWLPGDPKLAESLFVLFFFWIKSRYKNKCGGYLSNTIYKVIWDPSPNMLHNIDGLASWRTGQMGSREGWPNLCFDQTNSDFPQLPLLPLQMMVCANTLLLLPKFLSLNEFVLLAKNKLNEPSQSPYALHALPSLYSLQSF